MQGVYKVSLEIYSRIKNVIKYVGILLAYEL
jgi:hypothetical protein